MFYYLNGKITHIEPNLAVVDCGGVGFACRTTVNTLSHLQVGDTAKLYTYCHVKEDAFDIYGFFSEGERRSFEMLLSVSGVGPRVALTILSYSTPEAFASAIITGNEKALTAAPGVGKKLAQRLILELKDRLAKESFEMPAVVVSVTPEDHSGDAAAALTVLGYSRQEISKALDGLDMGQPLEDVVRQALKKMLK